ncbi:MAG: carboxypeptidase-like regulatory domain-containing protein [Vicinamibacterales bacterium]
MAVGCLVIVLSGACETRHPSAPGAPSGLTPPAPPATPSVNVSGMVVERVSGQPVEGVRVTVYPTSVSGWSRWPPNGAITEVPSDVGGRYSIAGVPAGFEYFLITWHPGERFVQQCATRVTLSADAHQDVGLTSLQNLAVGSSTPSPPLPHARTISGTVFENTEAGRQPVANAWVWLGADISGDVPAAYTLSLANGRYLLCGLPESRLTLYAHKDGYSLNEFWTTVEAGADTTMDIELKR